MKHQLQQLFAEILMDMGVTGMVSDVTISDDARNGEYTTNIAMRLSRQLKKSPMDIALQVKKNLDTRKSSISHDAIDQNIHQKDQKYAAIQEIDGILQAIDHVDIVAPGFCNIYLTEAALSSQLDKVLKDGEAYGKSQTLVPLDLGGEADANAKRIMVEFAHPNTHKAFHIGHLRNITTGESLIRLLEATGHEVIRANYQGDVGMHIAKCLWAMTHEPNFDPASVRNQDIHAKVEFLGKAYAAGSAKFETDEEAKKEIGEINKQIYAKDKSLYAVYQETRGWSLEYFAGIYARVNSHYDRLYFESETYESGKINVLNGLKQGIFEQSDGAIIFPGEKYGLHNRVFITREGNATYEGKDMGLAPLQHKEYHPDLIMHVLGPEQYSYTRVIFKAMDLLFPETAKRQFHKTYGWVKLKHGKMSSRTGQVVLGEWLLDEAKASIYEILKQSKSEYTDAEREEIAEKGAVAAVKYAFLRVGTDQEISFDLKESVSFDGDSGPYLLYTYARCRSVLRKATNDVLSKHEAIRSEIGIAAAPEGLAMAMNTEERALARFVSYYPEIVADAVGHLSPNTLCTYLFRLASVFNALYQKHPIVGSQARIDLTTATAQVLHNGLYLLGIETAERM